MRCVLVSLLLVFGGCTGNIEGTDAGADPFIDAPDGAVLLPDGGLCVGTEVYFGQVAWPLVLSQCQSCHTSGGAADGTRLQLRPLASPSALAQNMLATRSALELESDGQKLLLLKPTGQLSHGGGTLFSPDSPRADVLRRVIVELQTPVTCGVEVRPVSEGVLLLDEVETLIKASFQLVGRPPTADEIAQVQVNGLSALDEVLTLQMTEPAFHERVREIFGDVLLTDGFRANNTDTNAGNILNSVFHANTVNRFGGDDYDWRSWPRGEGIHLVEALSREPLEFFVQAVKNDRPLSDVLTARHRLLTAYSARFYGVTYRGFAPGTAFSMIPNPDQFEAATSVPGINETSGTGEYAGVLTTPAWLLRYPSSPTNFNRKRARFTLKFFMDFDIMKAAPRIDAAAVDLEDTPTLRNMQCTGCHALLDPLAGMYLNEDECGYEEGVFYQPPGSPKNNACPDRGWTRATEMFPPGVAVGAASALPDADRPRALEVLGAHAVAQRGFARSMVVHVATSLWGRGLLVPPSDPTLPGYVGLDAASAAEATELERLTDVFIASGLRLPKLVLEVVKGQAFRAGNADVLGRVELTGLGGGSLVTPEVLDRKLRNALGLVWSGHGWAASGDTGYQRLGRHDGTGDGYLLQRERLKTLYGGLDGSLFGVKTRSRAPSSLTAAIVEHLALEGSCIAVTRDFDAPVAQRKLFSLVEKTLVPTGVPTTDAAILETIRVLHQQLLGARVTTDSEDVQELYALLREVQLEGAAAVVARTQPATLERPCAGDVELSTGLPLTGTTRDDLYVIRAWQAVVASLLMDPRFTLEK